MQFHHRVALLVVPVALATVLTGCGSNKPSATTAAKAAKATTFVLDEWSIVPPSHNLTAGKVAITATNNGREKHELVIVRAADAASLPLKADGSVNEDKIPESKKAGEIADLAAGKTRTKTIDLPAGNYIAFCNIVDDMSTGGMGSGGMSNDSGMGGGGMDHVHFKLGMVNHFTVV